MSFADNLKAARKKVGLTQKELGEKLNIPYQQIGQYETGKRRPKSDTLSKIAEALKLGFGYTKDGEPYFYDFVDTTPGKEPEENQRFNEEQYKNALNGKEYLLSNYDSVNDNGKKKIEEYSSDIAGNPKYGKDTD